MVVRRHVIDGLGYLLCFRETTGEHDDCKKTWQPNEFAEGAFVGIMAEPGSSELWKHIGTRPFLPTHRVPTRIQLISYRSVYSDSGWTASEGLGLGFADGQTS